MVKRGLAAILLMVALSVSAVFPAVSAYATESDDKEASKVEAEDKEHDYEDTNRANKIQELEDSIKEKQDQIKKAEEDRKKIKSSITDIQSMVNDLEKEKDDLSNYVTKLDADMEEIQDKIEELTELISEKEEEIEQAEVDLKEAEQIQLDQYNAMKARIKFMYEKGDSYYLEMLFKAKSFGDMVNKADYIEQLSAYDKKKLEEYVANCEYVEACKLSLESEKQTLDEAKAQVEEEEANLDKLITDKRDEINAKSYDISNKEQAIKEYEADLAEQTAVIQALEAAVTAQKKKLLEEEGNLISYDGGMFAWPAPKYTRISDDYGWRTHPILGVQQFHNGVDMAAPAGSPIVCAYDGEVVAAAYSSTMGNYIMVNHGDDLYTIYMHASAVYVSTGEKVVRGEKIGAVGSTGRSTGNHLHFSVRKNGDYVSPWSYLGK